MSRLQRLIRKWLGMDVFEKRIWDIVELNLGHHNKLMDRVAKKTGVPMPRSKKINLVEEYLKELESQHE